MTRNRLLLLACLIPASLTAAEKPNFVVIMADDLGYGDVSCNGSEKSLTPNIDRIASEGLRFTSGYCSASTCTPTRYSFLTGTYAFRTKGTGIAPPNSPALIQPGTPTIASVLQKEGYATAVIGKWHLGLGKDKPDWNGELNPGPLEIGFDHCLLMPTTNDRVPQVYVEDHHVRNLDTADPIWVGDKSPGPDHKTGISNRADLKLDWSHGHNGTIWNGISRIGFYTGGMKARFRDEDLADEWVIESKKWLEAHKDEPFFLFFAGHDIHVPRAPNERFVGISGMGRRGDVIVEFDWCVGEVMKTLERLKLADITIVVICSDNGPVLDDGYKDQAKELLGYHKPSGPFSGGKYSVLEGGTRTPFITYWKGHIKPGVSDEMVCTIDLATSFAKLAGATLPENGLLDSMDLSAALLGTPGAKGRQSLVQQDNNGIKLGFRSGDWKLIHADGIKRNPRKNAAKADSLYFLPKDTAEKNNVAADHPAELKRLQQELDEIIAAPRTRP